MIHINWFEERTITLFCVRFVVSSQILKWHTLFLFINHKWGSQSVLILKTRIGEGETLLNAPLYFITLHPLKGSFLRNFIFEPSSNRHTVCLVCKLCILSLKRKDWLLNILKTQRYLVMNSFGQLFRSNTTVCASPLTITLREASPPLVVLWVKAVPCQHWNLGLIPGLVPQEYVQIVKVNSNYTDQFLYCKGLEQGEL